jgi:hypothetical protein
MKGLHESQYLSAKMKRPARSKSEAAATVWITPFHTATCMSDCESHQLFRVKWHSLQSHTLHLRVVFTGCLDSKFQIAKSSTMHSTPCTAWEKCNPRIDLSPHVTTPAGAVNTLSPRFSRVLATWPIRRLLVKHALYDLLTRAARLAGAPAETTSHRRIANTRPRSP